MAKDKLRVIALIPASPENIYRAWLDGAEHSAFTGSKATVDPNGRFTAWDGYISGTTIDKHPGRRMLQTWRTTEFPKGSTDSRLEIQLERVADGTRITLIHTDIPEGQGERYKAGWVEHYFTPMRGYFAKFLRLEPVRKPPPPPPPKPATPVKVPVTKAVPVKAVPVKAVPVKAVPVKAVKAVPVKAAPAKKAAPQPAKPVKKAVPSKPSPKAAKPAKKATKAKKPTAKK